MPKTKSRAKAAPVFIDIPALATRWGCCYDYVWSRLRRGEIEGVRLGRSWRISLDSVARAEAAMREGK